MSGCGSMADDHGFLPEYRILLCLLPGRSPRHERVNPLVLSVVYDPQSAHHVTSPLMTSSCGLNWLPSILARFIAPAVQSVEAVPWQGFLKSLLRLADHFLQMVQTQVRLGSVLRTKLCPFSSSACSCCCG